MATTEQSTTEPHPVIGADFGANEWLVEEMYERYLADPKSVDVAWHDFFADYRSPNGAAPPNGPTAPRPESATTTAPPSTTAAPPQQPAAKPAAAAQAQAPAQTPAQATQPAGEEIIQLRGAAARVVQNMQSSLAVPTATSVRAVPAKLLADNRVVINNHLRRSRGGKVSFTHVIGYAVVKALADYPEMNNAFAEVDGKPALSSRPSTSTSASRSTCRARTARARWSSPRSRAPRRWTSPRSGAPTRTSSVARATAS